MSVSTAPRWFLLLLTVLATQVLLMLADVVFVFHYAHFSKPGLDQAAYNTFATETAGAFVFCVGPPVMYLIASWLCRKAGRAPLLHAGLLVVFYYLVDILIVIAYLGGGGTRTPLQVAPYLLNGVALLAAALLAGWHARSALRGQPGS